MTSTAVPGASPTSRLSRRAGLNGLALGVDYAVRLAVGFILNPLLVGQLGTVMYGTWVVLHRMIGQSAPAGGRPGEALKWVVASRQATTDDDGKRRQVGNAVAVWLLFLPLMTTLGAVLCWFAPLWLSVPSSAESVVRAAGALLVANLVFAGLANLPQAVLQGENLGYRRLGLSTSMLVVGGLLTFLALHVGAGIVGVAAATTATTVLSGLTYLFIVRSHVPWFGVARPSRAAIGAFLGISWWFLLWNFVMLAMKGADLILLGVAGSAALAASYALSTYVPVAAGDCVAMTISAAMPGLGGLIGAGQLEKAARVRADVLALAWCIATVAGVGVLLWQPSFIGLWVGEQHYVGTLAMTLIAVMVLQFALLRTDANVIDLTLRLQAKVLLGLASLFLSVMIGWAMLTAGLGVAGLVAGFIVGRLPLTMAYPVLICRRLGGAATSQMRAVLRPLMTSALFFALAAWIGREVMVESWWLFALGASVTVPPVAALILVVGLPGWRRMRLLRRLHRMRGGAGRRTAA